MKILITGATGFVGKQLTNQLLNLGHNVNILTRDIHKAHDLFNQHPSLTAFEWNNFLELPPAQAVMGIDGVINLMGENIAAKKWTKDQKIILKESRVDSTMNLIKQIEAQTTSPLEFFASASAIGIYPVNLAKVLDEESPLGQTYLAELCRLWEEATMGLTKYKRKIIVRTGVVLERDGGALAKMLPPFKLGLGGPIGNGNQMMSWIHRDDLIAIYIKAATDNNYNGVINGTTQAPVNNFDFTKELGHAIHRPTLIPVPAMGIKLAFGEMSTVILDSQAVISKRLPELGFKYLYPTISSAFKAIFSSHE